MARLSLAEVGLLLLLVVALVLSAEASEKRLKTLRRKKREWIIPPCLIKENHDYTKKPFIAKIRSDKDSTERVQYQLSGPGADKPPFNLFVVNHETGFVRINGILDREKKASYNLTGKAIYMDGNKAEEDIPLIVKVLDENDNAPYFKLHTGNVIELSKKGSFVMQIEGKDDDQEGTINSEISYKIISQEPEGSARMFHLESKTGKLYVNDAGLDRETCDYYKLVVQGSDLGGAAGGLTGTGTVEIKVLDINDNKPILEKSEYEGSVDENVADVIVMRIKALDADLEPTDNWKTVFKIVKGNEDDLFTIETDEKTNEGILKLVKPVDFEELQKLALGLSIENVAPFVEGGAVEMDVDVQVGQGGPVVTGAGVEAGADVNAGVDLHAGVDMGVDGGVEAGVGLGLDAGLKPGAGVRTTPKQDAPEKTYSILISVNNMPEGPAFRPDTKIVPVSEDPNELPKDGVLTSFPAIDPDTGKQAEDVSYAKAYDPDNWFTIDEETAEIKLNKAPDRESPFLVNGTYIAKILAISEDVPSKTATGTIAIQVADSNDHCPTLTTSRSSLCSDSKTVNVTGIDEDVSPNAAPFSFEIIPDGTRGKWEIKRINDTSAALHSHEMLWPGEYKLQVKVTDNKGLSCSASEPFILEVCDCVEGEGCDARTAKQGAPSSELSASAIGLLLMALCLLLLIPLLLLLCQCGGADTIFPDQFSDIPFDAKEHLISYHTEGRGEDKEVPLQSVPIMMGTQKKVEAAAAAANFNSAASKITETHQTSEFYDESVQQFLDTRQRLTEVDNAYGLSRESFNNSSVVYGRPTLGVQRSTTAFYDDMALPNSFLNEYYSQKAECAVPVKDSLMDYGFEGQGSPTGSLGCCSLLESNDDLQFLNDLGSKFKTLAEICSPPTPTPKPSLTHKVTGGVKASVDIVEPVVRPKIEHNVETRHTDIKTEKVMSSTNISKSSVSTMSTAPQSMTLPRTNNTNISQSSNISHSSYISHSATLPRQAQTVILQQQPVYYATSPVLQPMHYVVQPQLQNTVLLANEAQGSNVPGFYVVSGPQNPSSGLVISGPPRSPSGLVIQGIGSPKSPASPASPVSPTLLLPGSPGVSQGTVPGEGWKMVGPNPDGNYMLVMDKSSPGEAEGVDPGSSQGTLPRGAILVKEAAPPQGVLGPAAQGSVYGILPGHTVVKNGGVVAVNSNLGQTWVGQPGQMGLRPVNILGVGAGQPRMGHVVTVKPEGRHTGIWPPGINSVGIRQISVNQSQGIPPMEQTRDPSGIPKEYRIESPKEDKTTSVVNTVITTDIITAEAVKTNQSPKEEVMTKKLDDSDPTQNMRTDTVEEQQDVISKASEHDPALNDEEPREVVQEYQTQTSEKSSIADLEEDIVKSLPGSEVMQTSFEQSDTVVEKLGDTTDEIVPDQLNKITQAPTNTFTDVESPTAEASDPQQNIEEEAEAPQAGQQENLGPAEGYSKEDVFMVTEMSSTEALRRGSDVSDLGNTDEKGEETTAFHQGEEATSTSDHLNIVDDQIHDSAEENVGRQEAAPLKEEEVEEEGEPVQLSTVAAPDDRSAEVESESQSNQVSEDQSDRDLEQDVSPAEEVVSALETNQVIATSDSVQAEEIMEERTTVTSDTHEDVMAKQEQMLDSDVELDTVDAHLLATAPNEISMDTMIVSEERSIPDQEAMPELEVDRSEGFQIGEGHAQRDIVDAEARTSLQTGSIILANQEEGDLGDSNLISASEEITTQVQAEGSTVPTISTLEQHVQIAEDEDDDDQQRITSESGEDKDQVSADTDSVSDGEKEGSIVEEGVSQQSFSTSDDQDEDIERQDGLSTSSQLEENFISDDNTSNEEKDEDAVEETVSPVQQNISSSDDQDEKSAKEDASSTSSQVDDTVMSDDNINGSEKEEGETLQDVTLPIQQNVSITHYQDEEIEGEDVSGRGSSLEDQLAAGDDIDTVETEDHIAEKVTSPIQPLLSITNDQDEEIGRADAGHATSTVEDQLISEDDTGDGAQEVSPVEQTTLSSDEDTQREYAPETVSQVETKLISDVHGEKEEIEAPSIHQNICISGDQDEDSEEEGAPGTSSHIQEEGIKSYQLSEEESQPLDTECLSAMSKVTDTQEMPSEITTHQVRRGLVSSQTGEIPLDIAERHILVRDANMEGLDDVVTSSGELMSSRVATGQVYMSSEDKGVGDSILASGQSAGGDLTLEKGNVEATFDPEIREGLDGSITHASGQVLPISSSEIEVVGKTISSTLETDPGSAEIGTASFIATSEVAEEAGDLVQNESVHITGKAAEIGPNTVGNAGSIDVESKVSDYMHGAEASGGEVSPVQTVISQTRNKFRRSKKDSSKKPQSPKSPSGKCKQQ